MAKKTKLNTDYNHVPLQCFAPETDILAVTGGANTDVSSYSVICMDTDTDLKFNDTGETYADWPANQPLQLAHGIDTIVFGSSCKVMYMK